MKDYIVVHDGVFHADDVYAVALAKLFNLKGSDNIIRTRNVDIINNATYELDVGGQYDNQRCFDHHQSLFNERYEDGTLMATAGLLWRRFGFDWLRQTKGNIRQEHELVEIHKWMQNEFFKLLDNWDNGIQIAEPGINIPQEIKIWNHPDIKSQYQNDRFFESVNRAKWLLPLLVDSVDNLMHEHK